MDRLLGTEPALTLADQREVDQHDSVLLDDADQQDDADDADHVEWHAEQHQGQQCPEPGRGQGRDDRDRVDRALVEHSEDDVDRDQRGENQDRRAAQRALKRLRAALEAGGDRGRQVELLCCLLDRRYRGADRGAGREVEAQSHRRKLALVVDRKRCDCRCDRRELAQRYLGPAGRSRVYAAECVRSELKAGFDFENDEVLVQPGV